MPRQRKGRSVSDAPQNSTQKYYRQRRKQGKCGRYGCGEQAVPGKSMCEGCLERMRESAKSRYRARKASGICHECLKPLPSSHEHVKCRECHVRMLAGLKLIKKNRVDDNRCMLCGKTRTRTDIRASKNLCVSCLEASRNRANSRLAKRRAEGRCTACGLKLAKRERHKMCALCRERSRDRQRDQAAKKKRGLQ